MPCIVGLYQAAQTLLSWPLSSPLAAATSPGSGPHSMFFALGLGLVLLLIPVLLLVSPFLLHRQPLPNDTPPTLPGFQWTHISSFFHRRHDFLAWGFRVTGAKIFQFKLMGNTVIVLSGPVARRAFFYQKGFDLTEGFKMLSGAVLLFCSNADGVVLNPAQIPMVRGVTSGIHTKRIATIHKRLASVQRNASLTELIPHILEDAQRVLEGFSDTGSFDPFDKIYSLIFQTTVRSLSCHEIADDMALVAQLKSLYSQLDTATTPASVLLPWLPSPAMLKKLWATKQIYDIIVHAIEQRERNGSERNDTLQMLLEAGDDKLTVVGFVMGLLIAGARATGTTASWVVTFLGGHVDWRDKARAEVEGLLAVHSSSSSRNLAARLAEIPLTSWESEMPVLDAVIRETLRVAQPHIAMRRNIGPDTYIDQTRIPTGAYVVYPFSDIHLDAQLYPNPWRFDPARTQPQTSSDWAYVGWGVGKTTCLGTRLAKLELKLVLALFLVAFDHEVEGPMPSPNWNDSLMCRPAECVVRYTKRGN
ncbi:Cytochrome P450 [Mycena indigotica]|uniref:Cytochrome P450 n=1 Tax=Mycena indigotica TaxID=2126181 RepID=A0A8H6WL27_9AGAR|nr:Cytochrome P450 [Mycena indigotica]KAF7316374.1 Cytochrome P450 [Mycena indigotica]